MNIYDINFSYHKSYSIIIYNRKLIGGLFHELQNGVFLPNWARGGNAEEKL